MSIKFKNSFIFILLCFLFLIVVVLFACSAEENIFINEKNSDFINEKDSGDESDFNEPESPPEVNEPTATFSDEELTIITTGIEAGNIGAGLVMFNEIDYKAMVVENRELTPSEKESTSKIIDYLKTGKYLMESTRDVAYKTNYEVINDEKTNEVSISQYERLNYYIGGTNGEMVCQSEWKFKERKAINQPLIYYSIAGQNDNYNTYCVLSTEFEQGTSWQKHRSTIAPNNTAWPSIQEAVYLGVIGYLFSHLHYFNMPTGRIITNDWHGLLHSGRAKLLSGRVVEAKNYQETATQASYPTLNDRDVVTLRFYIEDAGDFDYNDAFMTFVVSNGIPPPPR